MSAEREAMTVDVFPTLIERVLIHEGGYVNDPRDPGGETRWGISQRNHPSLDIKTLTREQAVQTYRRLYWQPLQGDALHKAVAFALFDASVNHGLRRAVAWLQNIVGTPEDGTLGTRTLAATQAADPVAVVLALHARRLAFYTDLDTFSSFGRGWTRRMAQNLRYAAEDLA
jgi:lysozyme family protein